MAVVLMVLVPRSGAILAERTRAIRSDLANALIVERQFLHPIAGPHALHHRHQPPGRDGRHLPQRPARSRARRSPTRPSARCSLREGMEARLVMLEGRGAGGGAGGEQLTAVRFDQFVFDLSDLIRDEGARVPRPSEYPVRALLRPDRRRCWRAAATAAATSSPRATTSSACRCSPLIYPMIALVTLLAGGYRRSGFGRRVVVAIAVAALLQVLMFAVRARVQERRRALAAHVPAGARSASPTSASCSSASAARAAAAPAAAGMTLWRYILRGFLRAVLAVFAVIALVIMLFTSVENLRRFGESGAERRRRPAHHAAAGAGGALPGVPAGADAGEPRHLPALRPHQRARGDARLRRLGAAADRGAGAWRRSLLGIGFVAVVNPFVAASIKRGLALEDDFTQRRLEPALLLQGGRLAAPGRRRRRPDGDPGGAHQRRRHDPEPGADAPLRRRRHALRPHRGAGGAADAGRLAARERHRVAARRRRAASSAPPPGGRLDLPTTLTSDEILESFAPPETVGFWDLGRFIAQMEESGFSGQRHRLFLQSELAKPALFAAMVLIGAAFALRPTRFGQTGVMILLAVLAGFALYFLKDFAESLGGRGQIPLLVAAWTPPVAAILLARRPAPAPRGRLTAVARAPAPRGSPLAARRSSVASPAAAVPPAAARPGRCRRA